MVNDPHRAITAPSLRYWVHLVAPGWNVIGGGEPHLPGVSIGHNEYGAWGLTIFPTDTEDLYVYETNPDNPNQYRYLGEWQDMRVYTETIPVKGQEPVRIELRYTRHGPILKADPGHPARPTPLRAAWREIGGAPYLASLRMDQAKSWEEFREACSYSRAALGEHGLGRPGGQHRLAGRRHCSPAAELERPAAGAGRRPLRVGRLSAD